MSRGRRSGSGGPRFRAGCRAPDERASGRAPRSRHRPAPPAPPSRRVPCGEGAPRARRPAPRSEVGTPLDRHPPLHRPRHHQQALGDRDQMPDLRPRPTPAPRAARRARGADRAVSTSAGGSSAASAARGWRCTTKLRSRSTACCRRSNAQLTVVASTPGRGRRRARRARSGSHRGDRRGLAAHPLQRPQRGAGEQPADRSRRQQRDRERDGEQRQQPRQRLATVAEGGAHHQVAALPAGRRRHLQQPRRLQARRRGDR